MQPHCRISVPVVALVLGLLLAPAADAGERRIKKTGVIAGNDGRAILNLTPGEAVRHCVDDLEMVGEELAHHRS